MSKIGEKVRGIDLGWPEVTVILAIIGIVVHFIDPELLPAFVTDVVLPVLEAVGGWLEGAAGAVNPF